jgi:TPR repeat protein
MKFRVLLAALSLVFAAKIKAQDNAPIMMSRFGGGPATWADVAELTVAANRAIPAAQAQLGEMLLRGSGGVAQDPDRGIALLEKAARAGESSAAFRIGMLLDDGDGVSQDRARALGYFKAAAVGGVAEAYHNVGAAYVGAHGVKRDYTEGLAWLILAKKRGVVADSETQVRARIAKLRHPEWITAGETRAVELEAELKSKTVAGELPPSAPLVYVEPKK